MADHVTPAKAAEKPAMVATPLAGLKLPFVFTHSVYLIPQQGLPGLPKDRPAEASQEAPKLEHHALSRPKVAGRRRVARPAGDAPEADA
jgi:hypothetical protein